MLEPQDLKSLKRQAAWSWVLAYLTYAVIILACRLHFRYRMKDLARFRAEVWKKLASHDGPVIWAANHLTLIDSFLVFWAVFPWSRAADPRRVPWSTPEYRNYYHLGGWLRRSLVRGLMYLCRCIPFLREGEDEASVRWREKAYEKCLWILKNGGSVFVYPEAGRAKNGWFEARRPKDFLGRLALDAPGAKFLCVYLRGEEQAYTTIYPKKGESFRMTAELLPAVEPGETTPRQVSQRLFNALGELQRLWFAQSRLLKNCGGNDIVDLKAPLAREHFSEDLTEVEPEWLQRHLTPKELAYFSGLTPENRYAAFWRFFAAKEASHKALAQSGILIPAGGFRWLEADLFRRRVRHLPTGAQTEIAFTDDDEDKLHCLAVLRGGSIGEGDSPGDVLWRVSEVPPGADPHEFVRESCLALIAQSSDEIPSPASLAWGEEDAIPRVLYRGKAQDWGVSLSHSGRYAASSFMIS